MALISLRNVSLGFRGPLVLDAADLTIEPGERVCLIGRNGTGKSTLLKLIAGELQADGGQIDRRQGLRVARLTQDVPTDLNGSLFDIVAGGLGEAANALDIDTAHAGPGVLTASSLFANSYIIETDGSGYTLLHEFAGGASDGRYSGYGSLAPYGSTLYGMTTRGGKSSG